MDNVITVGLDGSAESVAAARWAAGEADRRQLTLRLLHAWIMLSPEDAGVGRDMDQNYWAKRIVHDVQQVVLRHHPDLPVVEDLVSEEAATALQNAAAQSRMLVLGTRGLETVESFFLGDTSLHVVARAERPVVLVRAGMAEDVPLAPPVPPPGQATGEEATVAVGLSLHGPCAGLLDFAFDTAAGRGAPLHAIHGRGLPVSAHRPWGVAPDIADEVQGDARRQMSDLLQPWREKYPGVRVIDTVRLESPARAVVHAARGSDLLVIGRRRSRPAFAPRIGAVAHAVVHHAACPVAVVSHE